MIDVNTVLSDLGKASSLGIVVLDACRDNPLSRNLIRSLGSNRSTTVERGLAPVQSGGNNMLVSFSTGAGEVAADGDEKHSPYATAFLKHVTTPGLEVGLLFREIRDDVKSQTEGQQVPAIYASMGSDRVYLQPGLPTEIQSRLDVCKVYKDTERFDDAIDCYRQILQIRPNLAEAETGLVQVGRHYMASASAYIGEAQQAVEQADRVLQKLDQLPERSIKEGERQQLMQEFSKLEAQLASLQKSKNSSGQDENETVVTIPEEVEGTGMVLIRGGRFQMGSPASEQGRSSDESQHWVAVSDFYIAKYEVTFAEYDRFAEATGRPKPSDEGWGRGRRPVINVSWDDAIAYTKWLSEQTGESYRLPMEVEWEYAARANTSTARYWGELADEACIHANVYDETAERKLTRSWARPHACNDRNVRTALVGSYKSNAYGLHDMLGNVREWTCSKYEPDYSSVERRCYGKSRVKDYVIRGGSWDDQPFWVRSAKRSKSAPNRRFYDIGFRLAKSP